MDLEKLTPREREMATAGIPRMVLRYSIPTVIGMLVSALYVIVDRYFVAQIYGVGDDALAGVGLANPIMLIIGAFALLVGVGSAANISIRLGKGDRDGAEKILGNALTLNLLLSITFGSLALIFLQPLLRVLGASAYTMPFAEEYTRIKLYGILFMFISFAMNHPIRAAGNAKRFASAQLLGAILNIILNPLFIFTFDMGIAGAGWSTVAAQAVASTWVMMYYFRGKPAIALKFKNLKLETKYILAIGSIGIAPFFMQLLGSVMNIAANTRLMYLGGDHAVGAFTAISGVIALFVMPVFGIAQGSQPIIGFNYGMGDMKRVKTAYFYSAIYAVSICVIGLIFIMSAPGFIMGLFTEEYANLQIGRTGLVIMAATLPVAGFQMNASTFFMAINRAKFAVFLSILRQGLLLIPLIFILAYTFGITGVWWATPVADTAAFSITLILILRELKRIKKLEQGV